MIALLPGSSVVAFAIYFLLERQDLAAAIILMGAVLWYCLLLVFTIMVRPAS